MEESLYRDILLERLANPVNLGLLEDADPSARLVNPLCGDTVLLQIKTKNGVIDQAKYSGNGCAISQVAASFLAENIEGEKISNVKKIEKDDLLKWLEITPGPARLKCALLSLEALKQALASAQID